MGEPQQLEIIPHTQQAVALTPMDMLDRAITQGASIEICGKLMDLHDRWEAGQARKKFDAALAAAKAEIPVIKKNRHVGFESKKPGASKTDYYHEDLAEITRTIDPILGKHGLSYRFRLRNVPNEPITVTCVVFGFGHYEENTLCAGRDESGNKNSIQQIGSTVTYLERYTLKGAIGLAAAHDDDGKLADAGECITDEQVDEISRLLSDTKSNLVLFLKAIKLESLTEIRADKFDAAVKLIKENAKRREELQHKADK